MQPEISHRCPSCGASIREAAIFCPECGKPMANNSAPVEAAAPEVKPVVETAPAASQVSPAPDQTAAPAKADAETKTEGAVREGLQGARYKTRETLHRASSVARGAIEGNVKRVEKIHHVSTVMLEEATYDPSLRFVLVAVGLFVVFIILLILSKVMG
jgi:uncharacterized Zn finger protein (UPF0148 family)